MALVAYEQLVEILLLSLQQLLVVALAVQIALVVMADLAVEVVAMDMVVDHRHLDRVLLEALVERYMALAEVVAQLKQVQLAIKCIQPIMVAKAEMA